MKKLNFWFKISHEVPKGFIDETILSEIRRINQVRLVKVKKAPKSVKIGLMNDDFVHHLRTVNVEIEYGTISRTLLKRERFYKKHKK